MPPAIELQAAWDEYEPAQLAVHALRDVGGVEIEVSDLQRERARVLPSTAIDVRMERFYALHLSYRYPNILGVVPKTLEPIAPVAIAAGTTRPYWLTVHVSQGQAAGVYRGSITIRDAGTHDGVEVPLSVEISTAGWTSRRCCSDRSACRCCAAFRKPDGSNAKAFSSGRI
jgi:hypothetical protein